MPDAGNVSRNGERLVATVLDKELKRQITIDDADYTIAFDPEGVRVIGKGKRRPEVELRWRDLLNGEAALAVALSASVSKKPQASAKPRKKESADRTSKPAAKKRGL